MGRLANPSAGSSPERKILLAVGNATGNHESFLAALSLCKRMSASLDILCVTNCRAKDNALEDFLLVLESEKVFYRLVKKVGNFDIEVADYVNHFKSILFVVMPPPVGWPGKKTRDYWGKVGCPLVITGGDSYKK